MRILVVEDDKKIAGFIKKGLTEELYSVDVAYDGEIGLYMAIVNEYDLILLDVMLPKKNGFEICQEIRNKKITTPIIIITAKDSVDDVIKGLDEGADDYLTKPFSYKELLARIRALLRRNQDYKTGKLTIADLELDPVSRQVYRSGKKITLTAKEFALLEYLLRNKNRILTETMILEHVWGTDSVPFTNIVNVYIHHLRQKIDKNSPQKLIHTVRGMGYTIKDEE